MKAKVFIRLKSAILDPQGKTVQKAAAQMGYEEFKSIRIGKMIEMEIDQKDREIALQKVNELSRKLLSNPQMETFEIELSENE